MNTVGTRPSPADRPHVGPMWTHSACGCDEWSRTFDGRPGGIAIGPDGTVFVSSPSSGRIWRIDPGGVIDDAASPGGVPAGDTATAPQSPTGLAADGRGTLAVADSTGRRVWATTPAGTITVVAGGAVATADVLDEDLRPGTCLVQMRTGR